MDKQEFLKDLPEITKGSKKQIAWAEKIRSNIIMDFAGEHFKNKKEAIVSPIFEDMSVMIENMINNYIDDLYYFFTENTEPINNEIFCLLGRHYRKPIFYNAVNNNKSWEYTVARYFEIITGCKELENIIGENAVEYKYIFKDFLRKIINEILNEEDAVYWIDHRDYSDSNYVSMIFDRIAMYLVREKKDELEILSKDLEEILEKK